MKKQLPPPAPSTLARPTPQHLAEQIRTRSEELRHVNLEIIMTDNRVKAQLNYLMDLDPAHPEQDQLLEQLQEQIRNYVSLCWLGQHLIGLLSGEIPDVLSTGHYFSLSRQRWCRARLIGEYVLVESLSYAGDGELELVEDYLFDFSDWCPVWRRHYEYVLDHNLDQNPDLLTWTLINF
jgi:hypothetical protein